MIYIEAPDSDAFMPKVFLAGGITDCPDWQSEVRRALRSEPCVLLNPRRENFPIDDPDAAEEQITWEHRALRAADAILFWFPKETLCPIVSYELGAWSMTDKPIFVGCDPKYMRQQDVVIQMQLARPEIEIFWDLPVLIRQVRSHVRSVVEPTQKCIN